ncbi:MAG: hypothetical protein ACI4M9_07420 [Succinivibrio sp.]
MRNLNKIIFISAALTLCGCNSSFFDSDVTPNASKIEDTRSKPPKKVVEKQTKKPVKIKPVIHKDTEADKLLSESIADQYSNELKAGVVKPYVPDDASTSTLLPKVEGLKEKNETSNPLTSVSIKDVIEGKVDLNKLQHGQTEASSNQNTEQTESSADDSLLSESVIDDSTEEKPVEIEGISNSVSEKCSTLSDRALSTVSSLASTQAGRLNSADTPIFVAHTVISSNNQDCLKDLSSTVRKVYEQHGLKTISANLNVSQSNGSSVEIPALIRACRQYGIPVLNISVIRESHGKVMVNLRNIRVKDGITLVQGTAEIK